MARVFFSCRDVAAEIWIEKDKGHGVQAVNNPPGCSKNCPHIDVLTEKSLVLIPYSTTAHEKKTIQCQFICAEYLKLWETEKNEAAFVLTMGRFNKGCAEALFSSLLSCSGEREPLCCQCPPTATLWLHPVSIAFVLEIVTSIDLGDKFCLVCASLLTWYWKAKFVSHCFFWFIICSQDYPSLPRWPHPERSHCIHWIGRTLGCVTSSGIYRSGSVKKVKICCCQVPQNRVNSCIREQAQVLHPCLTLLKIAFPIKHM